MGFENGSALKASSRFALQVLHIGQGPVDGCHSLLQDDQIQYIIVKIVDDSAPMNHFDSKYVFVMWSGQRAKPLVRAKCSGHKDSVMILAEQVLDLKFSSDMTVNSIDELIDDELRKKVFGRSTRRGTSIFTGDSGNAVLTSFSNSMSTRVSPERDAKPAETAPPVQKSRVKFAETSSSSVSATEATPSSAPISASINTTPPPSSFSSQQPQGNRPISRQRSSTVRDAMRAVMSIDKDVLEGLLKDIHDPSKPIKWCLLSYDTANSMLRVTQQGDEEQLPERHNMNDRDMQYIVININMHSETGYGADNTKTIFITWIGPSIAGIRRAKCVQHKGEVFKYCNSVIPIAAEQQITTEEEYDIVLIRQRVAGSQGKVTDVPIMDMNGISPSVSVKQRHTSDTVQRSDDVKKKKKSVSYGDLQTTVQIEDEQELIVKLLELHGMCNPEAGDVVEEKFWILLSYVDNSDILRVEASDSGDIETLQSKLPETDVKYVFYKTVFGNAPKIVLVTWVGTRTRGKRKALSTAHRSALQNLAEKHIIVAGACELMSHDEVKDDVVETKITGTKGSPRSYTRRRRTVFGGQSQDLRFVDESHILDALRELNDDSNNTTYLLFSYKKQDQANSSEQEMLELRQKGEGTSDDIRSTLSTDQVQFVLVKMLVEEEGYGGSPKVILVTFAPPEADMFQKAKSSTDRIALKAFAEKILSVGGEYQCMTLDEFNDDAIKGKITGSKGKVEVSRDTFVRTRVKNRSQTVFKRFGGGDSTLKFDDMKLVDEAFDDLKSSDTRTSWLMFGYCSDEDPNRITVVQRGSGGVDSLKPYLTEDNIMYIVRRLSFMEYHEVCKVIVITWVGENVDHWGKAKSSGHRVNLYEFAKGYVSVGGEFQPLRMEDLTDNNLIAKITGSRGEAEMDEEYLKSLEEDARQRWEASRQIGPKANLTDLDQYTGQFVPIEFSGRDEFRAALELMDQRGSDIDFIKLSMQGKNLRDIVVEETGNGALSEDWCAEHLDTTRTLLFVFAITTSEAGYGVARKYALVQWVGNDVKHRVKAKANEMRQSLFEFVNSILPMAAELHGSLSEHVTRETVLAKIMGTHVRGREMHVRHRSDRFASMGRGNWKLKYADQDAISDAIRRLVDEEDEEVDWIAVTYTPDSLDTLQLHAVGSGRNLEWKSLLAEDNVVFVVFSIMFTFGYKKDLELLTGESHGDRYFGMCEWLGSEVNHFEIALTSHHFNNFQKLTKTTLKKHKCTLQGSHLQPHALSDIERPWVLKIMNLYD